MAHSEARKFTLVYNLSNRFTLDGAMEAQRDSRRPNARHRWPGRSSQGQLCISRLLLRSA